MNNLLKNNRIESIDLLRGIVMIIMALDHVRDYFHADAYLFNPLNLDKTNAAIFATRWITHFCAPVFVFLAGTSAYLVGIRKGKKELSKFLFTRGLWLIVLELTVVNFSWFFNIHFSMIALTVIWALGVCMIILAGAIHLPFKAIFVLGILFIAGHNLLDGVHIEGEELNAIGWALLHEFQAFDLAGTTLFVGYGLIPWTGVMFLGYCFGWLYQPTTDAIIRKKALIYMGSGAIILFVIGRLINVYGDPVPWTTQSTTMLTFLSFMNIAKYPPSIFYILATLGPAFLFLAFAENLKGKLSQNVISLGRVPMFYYIVHLYLIHVLALIAALATGYDLSDMVFTSTWVTDSPNLVGYGFSLGFTYFVWIAVVLALFPLCIWYDGYKTRNKEKWWLSYL
jgi:uncharacterized membrane protein